MVPVSGTMTLVHYVQTYSPNIKLKFDQNPPCMQMSKHPMRYETAPQNDPVKRVLQSPHKWERLSGPNDPPDVCAKFQEISSNYKTMNKRIIKNLDKPKGPACAPIGLGPKEKNKTKKTGNLQPQTSLEACD